MSGFRANNPEVPRVRKGSDRTLIETEYANALIDTVNALQNIEVSVTTRATSGIKLSGKRAILYINPKDINLGEVTGSAGSNAALESLLTQLAGVFNLTDSST